MSPRSQPPVDALDREAVERFEHSKRLWCGATLTEPDGYRRCCTRPPHRDPIHIESEDCDPPMVARWQDEPGAAPRACYHDDWPANQREQQAIIDGAVADGLAPLWPPQGTPGDGGTIWFRWVDRGTRAVGHSEAPSGHCGEPGSAPLRVSPPASPVEPTPLPDGTVERIDDEDGARVWLITPHRAEPPVERSDAGAGAFKLVDTRR